MSETSHHTARPSAGRGALLLLGAAALGGAAMAVPYGSRDGLLTGALLALLGGPVLVLTHVLAARRPRAGTLARQFAFGVGLTIGLALLGVGVVASLLFVSAHDAFTLALLLAFAGTLATYTALLLAGGVMEDLDALRAGVRAVGQGARDVRMETGAHDELSELAGAVNAMVRALAAREAERDRAEAARRDLMAAVSHDLRSPLAALRVLAEALEDDALEEASRHRQAGHLALHVRALGDLVDDLFELSRLEAGDVEWPTQPLPLHDIVAETVEAMQAQARAKSISTRTHLAPELPAAEANPEKVQRVLFNLLQNAIRHTPAHGTVCVEAEAVNGHVEVEVADTGPGIAPTRRELVFEPFQRGLAPDGMRGGAGLGLTICRAIVEAHGGQIWLAESSAGTRVRFSLPVAAPRPDRESAA